MMKIENLNKVAILYGRYTTARETLDRLLSGEDRTVTISAHLTEDFGYSSVHVDNEFLFQAVLSAAEKRVYELRQELEQLGVEV